MNENNQEVCNPHPLNFKCEADGGTEKAGFDGERLYYEALDLLSTRQVGLADPARRQEWTQHWGTKRIDKQCFKDAECTDKLVEDMVKSLGFRFDRFVKPEPDDSAPLEESDSRKGIGVFLSEQGIGAERRIIAFDVMEGSPAYEAGLRPGDQLLKIGNVELGSQQSLEEIGRLIRVDDSEKLDVYVRDERAAGKQTQLEVIGKKSFEMKSVVHNKLDDGSSYIKLREFTEDNVAAMKDALHEAQSSKGIILDLRRNPGGDADAANSIAQMFLRQGRFLDESARRGSEMVSKSIIFEQGFVLDCETGNVTGTCQRLPREKNLIGSSPVVVLIDQDSASAAEILAGAFQGKENMKVVGVPTMGKGEGQVFKRLPEERGMWLSTFYFEPGGKNINWTGVLPDVEVQKSAFRNVDAQLERAKIEIDQMLQRQEDIKERRANQIELHQKSSH